MQRNDNFILTTFLYLDDNDKSCLRRTSKFHLNLTKKYQLSPYQTKAEFVIAVTGRYKFTEYTGTSLTEKSNNLEYIKLLENYLKTNIIVYSKDKQKQFTSLSLVNAWHCYKTTINSNSKNDALLYRLCEYNDISKTEKFKMYSNNENLIDTQRKYSPIKPTHNWDINQAWVLAQIHKGRSFMLFSSINEDTKFRNKNHQKDKNIKEYSAFSREIASIMKVGYEVTKKDNLSPNGYIDYKRISIDDLNISNQEIEKNLNLFKFNNKN